MAMFCVSLVGEIKYIYREEKTEDGGRIRNLERVSEKGAEGSKWLLCTSSLRN
jgi:hypothetical protein